MLWIVVFIVSVLLCCGLLAKYWRNIAFQFKFIAFLAIGFLNILILLPTTFRRPGSAENCFILGNAIAYTCRWIGVKYELRGQQYLAEDQGALVAANHQQMIDLLGVLNVINEVGRIKIIMKRQLGLHPGGWAARMYGVIFLDRASGPQSHQTLNSWAFQAKEEKYKVWIHPEGTRNFEGFKTQCLLPFKKGTFHAAIAAQIPIIPYVFSPYCFINHDRFYFGRGKVIMEALEPISTVGMTVTDLPYLMQHLRDEMTKKYRQLSEEVLSELPSGHPVFQWINDVQ